MCSDFRNCMYRGYIPVLKRTSLLQNTFSLLFVGSVRAPMYMHGRRLVWAGGGVRFSGKWNSIWMSERTRKVDDGQGYFYQGARGHCPPLNFNNPKRSKIVSAAYGTIIRRVVAVAKCKSSVIDFGIFFKYLLDVL